MRPLNIALAVLCGAVPAAHGFISRVVGDPCGTEPPPGAEWWKTTSGRMNNFEVPVEVWQADCRKGNLGNKNKKKKKDPVVQRYMDEFKERCRKEFLPPAGADCKRRIPEKRIRQHCDNSGVEGRELLRVECGRTVQPPFYPPMGRPFGMGRLDEARRHFATQTEPGCLLGVKFQPAYYRKRYELESLFYWFANHPQDTCPRYVQYAKKQGPDGRYRNVWYDGVAGDCGRRAKANAGCMPDNPEIDLEKAIAIAKEAGYGNGPGPGVTVQPDEWDLHTLEFNLEYVTGKLCSATGERLAWKVYYLDWGAPGNPSKKNKMQTHIMYIDAKTGEVCGETGSARFMSRKNLRPAAAPYQREPDKVVSPAPPWKAIELKRDAAPSSESAENE